MEEKIVNFANECEVYIDHKNKLLKVIWNPLPMLDVRFRELLEQFTQLAKKYNPHSIFVDARLHKHGILANTQEWHDEVIIPRYIAAGVKRMAFLTPANVFSELSHKSIFERDRAKSKIDTRFFSSETEAFAFLQEEPTELNGSI
jgi:hypothetical protein